jgi:hypothetical protein
MTMWRRNGRGKGWYKLLPHRERKGGGVRRTCEIGAAGALGRWAWVAVVAAHVTVPHGEETGECRAWATGWVA